MISKNIKQIYPEEVIPKLENIKDASTAKQKSKSLYNRAFSNLKSLLDLHRAVLVQMEGSYLKQLGN